jgi:endoglucanase
MRSIPCFLSTTIFLWTTGCLSSAEPARLATRARLDVYAEPDAGQLTAGRLIAGVGNVERMSWRSAAEQPRGYVAYFDVSSYAWREVTVQFTPEKSGTVALTLSGEWAEQSPGVLWKQEVVWDDLRATGTAVTDGGWERDAPRGWKLNGGRVLATSEELPAAEGSRLLRTWHNATATARLTVQAGQPVTLTVKSRAVRPEGTVQMARIADRDTPAHRAVKRFSRGVNFGNDLEAPKGQSWGAKHDEADFSHARAEGFDHVRLPIAWHHYSGPAPQYTIAPELFARIDSLVAAARKHELSLILNIHHFDALNTDPVGQQEKFWALWEQIAAHYRDEPNTIAFELLNEANGKATTQFLNGLYAEAIARVRRTNPHRTLFVGPSQWNQVHQLPLLNLPESDRNLIVTIHSYDPHNFTHQGAPWSGPDSQVVGIQFPGPPDVPLAIPATAKPPLRDWLQAYNIEPTATNPSSPGVQQRIVNLAKEWSDYYGRPVHLGEFGAYEKADVVSRGRYCREFRQACERAGIAWALWDWKAGFRYWNPERNAPVPEMREALFGR